MKNIKNVEKTLTNREKENILKLSRKIHFFKNFNSKIFFLKIKILIFRKKYLIKKGVI